MARVLLGVLLVACLSGPGVRWSLAAAPARTGGQVYAEAICTTSADVIACEDFNYPTNHNCTGDGGLMTWLNPAQTQPGGQFQAPAGSCSGVTIATEITFPRKPQGVMASGSQGDHVLRQNSTVDTRNGIWLFLRQNDGDPYANGTAAATDFYVRFQIYWTSDWTWTGDPKPNDYDYGASGVDHKLVFVYPPAVRNICSPTDCSYDAGPFLQVGNWDGTRRYADGLQVRIGSGGGTNYATFPNDYGSGNPNPHLEYRPFQCQTNTAACWRNPNDSLLAGRLFRFNTDRWYTMEFRYRLSTVNVSNGQVTVWIDGTQIYDASDLRTCTSGSETPDCSGLGVVYISHYHNNSDTTNFAGSQVIDNVVISRAPIGVPVTTAPPPECP